MPQAKHTHLNRCSLHALSWPAVDWYHLLLLKSLFFPPPNLCKSISSQDGNQGPNPAEFVWSSLHLLHWYRVLSLHSFEHSCRIHPHRTAGPIWVDPWLSKSACVSLCVDVMVRKLIFFFSSILSTAQPCLWDKRAASGEVWRLRRRWINFSPFSYAACLFTVREEETS